MGDNACEDEGRQEGEGEDEGVEVAVVALPHAVAHPGAVVIKPLDAVVADAAVRGAWGTEHFAGVAVLELHHVLVDDHFHRAGRQAVRGGPHGIDALLQVRSLTGGGSGQDPGVPAARLEEAADDEEEEDSRRRRRDRW